MTTSGVTDWQMTARQFVTEAMVENGILKMGREPRANELSTCLVRLNAIVKGTRGLWLEADATATVDGGDPFVILDAGIADVVAARLVVSATNSRPLAMWERDDYFGLPNRLQTSASGPTAFYAAKELDAIKLHVWPVPTLDADLELDVQRVPETITNAGQTLDIPQRYHEAMYTVLARKCARLFGIQPAPDLIADADRLERQLFDAERPESYFMGPAYYPDYHA